MPEKSVKVPVPAPGPNNPAFGLKCHVILSYPVTKFNRFSHLVIFDPRRKIMVVQQLQRHIYFGRIPTGALMFPILCQISVQIFTSGNGTAR